MTNTATLKPIGKGAFTKAFLNKSGKVVLESTCPVKEALSFFPVDHRLFPKIERIDFNYNHRDELVGIYEMKYFPRKRSIKNNLTSRQYELYKELRKINLYQVNGAKFGDEIRKAFDSLPNKFKAEKEALKKAVDSIMNFTDYPCFEISPRNIAIEGKKLILLDCFFCRNTLDKVRSRKCF